MCMSLSPSECSEIFAEYERHDGFENRVMFSQGNRVVKGRDRCLLVPDSWKAVLSFCSKRNNQQGETIIDD